MVRLRFLKHEVIRKMLFLTTISLGGWIIFDQAKSWLVAQVLYEQYWWAVAVGLLWLGMVILDLE